MNLVYCFILISSVILNDYIHAQFVLPPINLDKYDAYGSLLAMNEYLSILAQNDQERFTIITYPFTNRSNKCTLPYDTIQHRMSSLTRFVYNVAIGAEQNASQLVFSYIDENWRRDVFLTIVFLQFTDTGCVRVADRIAINMTDLNMQEHALIGMDPYGKRAYAVGIYYIVCIEIETSVKWQLETENWLDSQDNVFFPKAIAVTDDHYIFAVGQRFTNLKFLSHLLVLNFQAPYNPSLSSAIELSDFNFGPSAIDITRYSTMSISFLDQVEQFIIGIPHLNMLLFLSWDHTNPKQEPVIVRKFNSSQKNISFGKFVALLDNNTYAVLAHTLPTLPWSTSQVQIYSLRDEVSNNRPLTVYPNNQQVIPTLNFIPPPHHILTIVSWKSHLGLVFDAGAALLLSASPPGYCSSQIDENLSDMNVYISVPCIPGTARNTTSFGPCFLCQPQTKNNGTSGIECETCTTNDSLLCLRGALVEIPLMNITNYNQATPYPNSPDLVEFDDILMQNIFSFVTRSPRCFVLSPLLWTSLAIGSALIIFITMCILMCFPQWKSHRRFLKILFKHMDLIGEGEVWFGGLLTFAIVVLIAFTCKFSASFTRLYPIETITSNSKLAASCDFISPNAKFISGLQLLSIAQHDEEQRIFTMLDQQNITLTVYFLGTSFSCNNITIQQNLNRGQQVPSHHFNCSYAKETSILSVSTLLHQHLITKQFNLMGPYFIGGLRICLSGPSRVEDDEKYTLRELRFCQFYYTDNETLTINPTIGIKMTKVVNRTVGYTVSDVVTFSGIWIPTLTPGALSDVPFFDESGEYIRYLSDRISLVVDMIESEFFVKNAQEPIARYHEIVLHTLFFTIVFLELFGLFFLLIKLLVIPLVKLIQRRCLSNIDRSAMSNKEQVQLVRFVSSSIDETPKSVNP